MEQCLELARKGWSRLTVEKIKEALRSFEVNPRCSQEAYLSNFLPLRVLLSMSDIDVPRLRLLWHRGKLLKHEKVDNAEWLDYCSVFASKAESQEFEAMTLLIRKAIGQLSGEVQELGTLVFENYLRNLWDRFARIYRLVDRSRLLEVFQVTSPQELRGFGFVFTESGQFVEVGEVKEDKVTENECLLQMKILEKTFARIEKHQG